MVFRVCVPVKDFGTFYSLNTNGVRVLSKCAFASRGEFPVEGVFEVGYFEVEWLLSKLYMQVHPKRVGEPSVEGPFPLLA